MAKPTFLHLIFLLIEPANARVLFWQSTARNYVAESRNCQKERSYRPAEPARNWNCQRTAGTVTCRDQPIHTVFEALAADSGSFVPRRFSRKLANMALARAGKSRWIRSMR